MTDIDSEKTIVGNFNYVTIVHKHESVSLHSVFDFEQAN